MLIPSAAPSPFSSVQDHKSHHCGARPNHNKICHPYHQRYGTEPIPKFRIASKGISADAAYDLIHHELELDGTPSLKYVNVPDRLDRCLISRVALHLS